jgi:formaldehyde-activating enzyme involved in methanogenesis
MIIILDLLIHNEGEGESHLMKAWKVVTTTALAATLVLSGCGAKEEAAKPQTETKQAVTETKTESASQASKFDAQAYTAAVKELVGLVKKEEDKTPVDWDAAQKTYDQKLKAHVQMLDGEYKDKVDEQLTAALQAGKAGQMPAMVVGQITDKLLQKTAFLTTRYEFKQASDNFAKKEEAQQAVTAAKEVYDAILKGTMEKRDKAYQTQLVSTIDAGFAEMNSSIEKGDNLAYNLGKQMVDKSIMKAFYLASGGEKGYAYKIEQAAKEGKKAEELKEMQAEGWAFFQSVKGYLEKNDKEATDYINQQFDLANDPKAIKGDKINQAYVRALAATAKGEYHESFENWGKDKAVVTSLEGALFLDMIKIELPKALGDQAKANKLLEQAQQHLEAVKAKDKQKAEAIYKEMTPALDKLTAYGK